MLRESNVGKGERRKTGRFAKRPYGLRPASGAGFYGAFPAFGSPAGSER